MGNDLLNGEQQTAIKYLFMAISSLVKYNIQVYTSKSKKKIRRDADKIIHI